jgi:two-component system nitrate/nitrite response regulator NarL
MRSQPFDTVLVGPSALLREGLAHVLSSANFRVVASAGHLRDITWSSKHHPVLLLIDSSDDSDSSVAQITLFKERHPSARVAVLTDHRPLNEMVSAFRAGANLCFAKCADCDAFIKALDLVMLGETILPLELLTLIGQHENAQEAGAADGLAVGRQNAGDAPLQDGVEEVAHLSGREKCILRCIVGGDSNKMIARKIDIAEATVKVHVKAILRKIRGHNRTQAAIWALNNFSSIWPSEPISPSGAAASTPSLLPPSQPIEPAERLDAAAVIGTPERSRKAVGRRYTTA